MPPKKKVDPLPVNVNEGTDQGLPKDPIRVIRTYRFPDGSQYSLFYFYDWSIYYVLKDKILEGECIEVDGKPLKDGIGEYKSDTERYIGHWKNDAMNGQGILYIFVLFPTFENFNRLPNSNECFRFKSLL